MIKITGLWPTKSGNGWSGRSGNTRILVLPVDKSKTDNPRAPDYELLLAPIDEARPLTRLPATEPVPDNPDAAKPQRREQPIRGSSTWRATETPKPPEDHPAFDDDVPF
jgi:hypothetical protein